MGWLKGLFANKATQGGGLVVGVGFLLTEVGHWMSGQPVSTENLMVGGGIVVTAVTAWFASRNKVEEKK